MSALRWAIRGALNTLDPATRTRLLDRRGLPDRSRQAATAAILERVRTEGDAALRALAAEFDRVTLDALEVPRAEWERALNALPAATRSALERAAENIREVHTAFRPLERRITTRDGVTITRRPDALGAVGVYAPGGRAAYPSSVLMGVVPAAVAGVREIIVSSPPSPNGLPTDVVLAAAAIGGSTRVFALGGAGAIGAMAFGTASVPAVDRIVGPGNAWVAEAKAQVASVVAIDAPAGPSELLIIADERANAERLARELLAQAEHDPEAAVVLLATSEALIEATTEALERQLAVAPRAEVARAAIEVNGAALVVSSIAEAIGAANAWAAEHLLVACAGVEQVIAELRDVGTVFYGDAASVAFGDYATGANHVLPTAGLARSYSGLSTVDFYRWTTLQEIDRAAAARLSADVAVLADAEGLPAHAAAARAWGTDA